MQLAHILPHLQRQFSLNTKTTSSLSFVPRNPHPCELMDVFSVAPGTIALLTAIGHATFTVTSFIDTHNDAAPAELTAINHQLASLCTLLTTILTTPYLTSSISPPTTHSTIFTIRLGINSILRNCLTVVSRITAVIPQGSDGHPPPTSDPLPELISLLVALKAEGASLRLALNMLPPTTPSPTLNPTAIPIPIPAPAPITRENDSTPTTQHQLGRIMEELGRLQGMVEEMHSHSRAPPRGAGAGAGEMMNANDEVMLRRYLDGLTSYAETVWSDLDGEAGRVVEEVGERAVTPRIEEEVWQVGGGGGEGGATPRREEEEVREGSSGRGVGGERGWEGMVGEERLGEENVGENGVGEATASGEEDVSGVVVGMRALDLRPTAEENLEIIVWYGQNKHKEGQGNNDPYITARRQLSDAMYYPLWTEVIEILEHRQSQFRETWANCWRIRRYPGRVLLCPCRLTCCSKSSKAGLPMEATKCGNMERIHAATPSSIPGVFEGSCPETHSTWGMA